MGKNWVLVFRNGKAEETLRAAIAKFFNRNITVDNRNVKNISDVDKIQNLVVNAKIRGNPVVVEKGAVGNAVNLPTQNSWMYEQRGARTFAFWKTSGGTERLITV